MNLSVKLKHNGNVIFERSKETDNLLEAIQSISDETLQSIEAEKLKQKDGQPKKKTKNDTE
jgi:hypothetical protein